MRPPITPRSAPPLRRQMVDRALDTGVGVVPVGVERALHDVLVRVAEVPLKPAEDAHDVIFRQEIQDVGRDDLAAQHVPDIVLHRRNVQLHQVGEQVVVRALVDAEHVGVVIAIVHPMIRDGLEVRALRQEPVLRLDPHVERPVAVGGRAVRDGA